MNTISFCSYHGGYFGEIEDLLDLLGLRWVKPIQFTGLVVRSLHENQTLKHDVCVYTRTGSQIALQFSNGKVRIWSNLTDSSPKWNLLATQRDKSLEMYALLMSISLIEAFNDDSCFDKETHDLYCRVKKIVYSYYGMDGDAYDEMLRSNREAYRKLCPDSRFRKRNNSYRILLFPIKLSYFEERINRDYKKIMGQDFHIMMDMTIGGIVHLTILSIAPIDACNSRFVHNDRSGS